LSLGGRLQTPLYIQG